MATPSVKASEPSQTPAPFSISEIGMTPTWENTNGDFTTGQSIEPENFTFPFQMRTSAIDNFVDVSTDLPVTRVLSDSRFVSVVKIQDCEFAEDVDSTTVKNNDNLRFEYVTTNTIANSLSTGGIKSFWNYFWGTDLGQIAAVNEDTGELTYTCNVVEKTKSSSTPKLADQVARANEKI